MGTNYEHVQNVCPTCGVAAQRKHIGKNHINFQAVVNRETDEVEVGTWQQWKERLRAGGFVEDEMGVIPTEQFIADVEATDPAARRRQYDWMAKYEPHRVSEGPVTDGDWLDPDGFSFTTSEFS